MPSVFDSVSALLSREDLGETLSRFIGTDRARLDAATQVAAPSLIGAMADRAAAPDSGAFFDLLDGDDGSTIDDVGRFAEGGDTGPGAGMLEVILGRHGGGLVDRLSDLSPGGGSSMSRLLPMLTPLVVGVVARLRSDGQLDNAATARLLADEKADLEQRGLLGAVAIPAAGAISGTGAAAGAATVGAGAATAAAAAGVGAVRAASGGARQATTTGAAAATAATSMAAGRGRPRGIGWLGWALGGVALVALAAIGLSRCGGDDSGTAAGGPTDGQTTTVNETDTDGTDGTDGADGAGSATAPTTATPTTATPTTATPTTATPTTATPTTAAAEPEQGATINELLDLEPVTFEVNSARITPEGETVLEQAIEFLAANPDASVEIGGHTDADGGEATNMALSQARAESVKAYLEGGGIDGGRMTPVGYGESKPEVENDTPENKAVNRRIEFTIL